MEQGFFVLEILKVRSRRKKKGKKVTHTMRGSKKDNYKRR